MRQPPHHGDRQPPGLPLHQIAGRGQLVDGRHDGRDQRIAVRVRTTAQVVRDPHPGRADREVRHALAPRPPGGVRHHDTHVDAELGPQALPDPPGGGVRVLGQQQDGPRLGVGGVDAGGRHDQPQPVFDDAQRPPAGDEPYRLRVDRGLAVLGREDPPLRLADDLRGDDEDVAVGEPRLPVGRDRGRDDLDEVVAGPHLGNPGHGPDAIAGNAAHARTSSASASAVRAIAAVASTSVIISGTARHRIPAASTSATASASTESTSHPSSRSDP